MNLDAIIELYQLISKGTENMPSRKQSIQIRKDALDDCISGEGFTKLAFDTRRIDQETEYNPRRGLQAYHRSENFVSADMVIKIQALLKLRRGVQALQDKYGAQPEWQDSYSRVLLSSLDKGLRINEQDGDFTSDQPGMGSFSYLEQLLHARYRLSMENIDTMSEIELQKVILARDEELMNAGLNRDLDVNKRDVGEKTYADLMEKAFKQIGSVKTSAPPKQDNSMEKLFGGDNLMEKLFGAENQESPEIERTVTITIKRR
jgi:hypothetical protein